MTTRHALKSDGAWVELRDVEDLRARDRKRIDELVISAVKVDLDTGGIAAGPDALRTIVKGTPDAVAALLITAWEIPYMPDAQLPRLDPDVIGDLTLPDYDRLLELVQPAVELLMPGRSNNPDDHADPQSPSGPASG